MKFIEAINRVHQVKNSPFGVLFSVKDDNNWGKVKCLLKITGNKSEMFFDEPAWYFTTFKSKLFIQKENGIDLITYDGKKDETVLKGNYFLSSIPQNLSEYLKFSKRDENFEQTFFLLDINYNLLQVKQLYDLKIEDYFIYKGFSKTNVDCYTASEEQKWHFEASQYGRIISRHRDTGEILTNRPNEIDGDIFGYQNLVFVPLRGGQLLALNAVDGSVAWFWEHDRYCSSRIIDNKIYKHDGSQIFEIDALTGTTLRNMKYSDNPLLKDFNAAGPFVAYPDVLILTKVYNGQICIIDRHTFEVFDFYSIGQKIPNTTDAIVWHQNKLYVLDLDNTLHIFEKE
jgi:outer membrane protein assembly factor BamB